MIPMVFWASLPPWPRLKAAADSSWRRRNRPSTRAGLARRKIHKLASMRVNPRASPNSGDSGMNRMVFCRLPASRTPGPALATPAPAKPPISACDEEVGSPSHRVRKFQAMAPTSPAKITASLTTAESTIWPTVLATWVWKTRKATKLNSAAQTTATRGASTRVETTVAIELAASWKPLEKSNTSASTTMATTVTRARSGILDDDGLHRVGDVFEAVERLLELLDDVLPDEHVAGRVLGVEVVEVGPGPPVQPVSLVLELVDGDEVAAQPLLLEPAQAAQPLGGRRGRPVDQPGLLDHRLQRLHHPVQDQHVGRGLDGVEHVVQLAGEGVDVLPVEGGDEGRVEPRVDGVGEPVALVLGLDQALGLHLRVDEVLDHVQELPGALGEVVRDLVEQVEVGLFPRKDPQLQASSRPDGEHAEGTPDLAEPAGDVVLGPLVGRVGEDVVGAGVLDQQPGAVAGALGRLGVEERRAVGDTGCLLHVVGHDHDRVVPLELLPDGGTAEGTLDQLVHVLGVHADDPRPEGDVLVDRLGERVGLLEDHADAAPDLDRVDPVAVQVLAVVLDLALDPRPRDQVVHPVQAPDQGALAAAGGTDEGGDLVLVDVEVDAAEGQEAAVVHVHVVEPEHDLGRGGAVVAASAARR